MAIGQNLVPLMNTKIAGKWMFIPLKMYLKVLTHTHINIREREACVVHVCSNETCLGFQLLYVFSARYRLKRRGKLGSSGPGIIKELQCQLILMSSIKLPSSHLT